jgi:hypothetical protein
MVVHSACLEMKHVVVAPIFIPASATEGESPRRYDDALGISEIYDWRLTNLKDPQFIHWLKPKGGREKAKGLEDILPELLETRVFKGETQPSHLELEPPLVLRSGKALRFRIRFVDGYEYSCQIRFVLLYGDQKKVKSQWYWLAHDRSHVVTVLNTPVDTSTKGH